LGILVQSGGGGDVKIVMPDSGEQKSIDSAALLKALVNNSHRTDVEHPRGWRTIMRYIDGGQVGMMAYMGEHIRRFVKKEFKVKIPKKK
jgi:hypothetical protein